MPSLPVIAKLIGELTALIAAIGNLVGFSNLESIKEEIEKDEELRLNAISRYERKNSRCVMHQNTEQRQTVFSCTRRILLRKNGINDASINQHSGSGCNTSEPVCNESRTIRTRKRVFHQHHGRRINIRVQRKIFK